MLKNDATVATMLHSGKGTLYAISRITIYLHHTEQSNMLLLEASPSAVVFPISESFVQG
jgi:hypothetical protein